MSGIIQDIKNFIELSNGEILDLNKKRLFTTTEATTILSGLHIHDYDSAKKLNKKLEEIGLIYKHRTDVWDITSKYDERIDDIVRFESGNIKWTIEGIELIIELIKLSESDNPIDLFNFMKLQSI